MPAITNEAIALLSELYAHKSSWACLTAFKPLPRSACRSRLTARRRHSLTICSTKRFYHQRADHYRSALSLAAYLTLYVSRRRFARQRRVIRTGLYGRRGSCRKWSGKDGMVDWRTGGSWKQRGEGSGSTLKEDVCARLEHDRKYGVTNEKLRAFVEASRRRETRGFLNRRCCVHPTK